MNENARSRTSRHDIEGKYANYFKVGHNPVEFLIDFCQFYRDNEEIKHHTRIITSPVYAQALMETLRDAIIQYEKTYGKIIKEDEICL